MTYWMVLKPFAAWRDAGSGMKPARALDKWELVTERELKGLGLWGSSFAEERLDKVELSPRDVVRVGQGRFMQRFARGASCQQIAEDFLRPSGGELDFLGIEEVE